MGILTVTRKPIALRAIHYTQSTSLLDLRSFMPDRVLSFRPNGVLAIGHLEGEVHVNLGDFILQGLHNDFYPVSPDAFCDLYTIDP